MYCTKTFIFDYSFCHPAKERATMFFWRCPKHDNYRGLESMMYAHQESFVCWLSYKEAELIVQKNF
jgi:hypothetical protein